MALITSDPALCIPQAELIFIAGLPIHHNPTVLRSIKPHMDMTKKVFVGSICAYGGFNWVAAEALGPGAYSLFGTQLIPWCCGTKEYGRTGVVFGAKRLLRIATEDGTDAVCHAGLEPRTSRQGPRLGLLLTRASLALVTGRRQADPRQDPQDGAPPTPYPLLTTHHLTSHSSPLTSHPSPLKRHA